MSGESEKPFDETMNDGMHDPMRSGIFAYCHGCKSREPMKAAAWRSLSAFNYECDFWCACGHRFTGTAIVTQSLFVNLPAVDAT